MIMVVVMGFSRKRMGRDRRPRYTAYYLDARGQERSAGTFATRRDADRAWQMVEASFAAGKAADPRRGRMTFQEYVEGIWFPNHVLEPSTRQSYHYVLKTHLMPTFGRMRMGEIMPAHVREWVTAMVARERSPANIRHCKIVLSAIFTTALNDLVIGLHPCRGVKSPTVEVKEFRILSPEEFDRLYDALPSGQHNCLSRRSSTRACGGARSPSSGPRHPPTQRHRHGVPQRRRSGPEVPSLRRSVRGQAVPEGQAVTAVQAERPAARVAAAVRRNQQSRTGRPDLRL